MKTLQQILDKTKHLVFFGGAGVSTASGIPDFRGEGGLYGEEYEGLPPETVLSSTFFCLQPEAFYRFYFRYMVHPEARPNAAHRKLYELEKADKLRGIVTQNIDGLHRQAGCQRVYELHGSVHENVCLECGKHYGLSWMLRQEGLPRCDCGGLVKPEVVLYGEPLDKWVVTGALREISGCDTLIVAGTSLETEPAASFLSSFDGRELVVINRTPTPADGRASLVLREDVSRVLGEIRV